MGLPDGRKDCLCVSGECLFFFGIVTMSSLALIVVLTLGFLGDALDPFVGAPALWTVKITPPNCTDGKPGDTKEVIWREYTYTGHYGCWRGNRPDEDFYADCNGTHLITKAFLNSSVDAPCRGTLFNTTVIKIGECVHHDWLGQVTGSMYTFYCEGMWCNSSCANPPCPMDSPCDVGTTCCMNGNGDTPCGAGAMCAAGSSPGIFVTIINFLRYALICAILAGAAAYSWKAGFCNICPWRRGYGNLNEMA
uniref:Uncharacterized protein n=1 Tax=Eutreptiella gymnastica TaxID=73025 RepID=A0A6U8K852_9EUGL